MIISFLQKRITISFNLLKKGTQKTFNLKTLSTYGLLDIVLKEFIKEQIIEEIKLTFEEEKATINNWMKQENINDEKLEEWLKINLQSKEEWKKFIMRDLKWEKWCIENFKDKINDYYKVRKPFLDKYIYSIIRVKDYGLSQELYLRLKENESDFRSIAVKYSEGIEKKTGGLIGPVNINNPHPIISNLLKTSKDKKLWQPKNINDWWVIIKLEERINIPLDYNLTIKLSMELGESFIRNKISNIKKNI